MMSAICGSEFSVVPSGLKNYLSGALPNVETLGYSQMSLRDKSARKCER
jgi:hypothetical protein